MIYKLHVFANELIVENTQKNSFISVGIEPRDIRTVDIHTIASLPGNPSKSINVECIYGIYSLLSGPHLAVITSCNLAAIIPPNKNVFRATNLQLFPISSSSGTNTLSSREKADEKEYIRMICSVITSKTFYFSFDYDITSCAQRIAFGEKKSTLAERADEIFFWNRPVVTEFIDRRLYDWIVPVMSGYIHVSKGCEIKGKKFDFVFITRRSYHRVGTRFNIRGADKNGDVANFAESEMLVVKEDSSLVSYVQIRGSIPLYWDQLPSLKYMPRTRYAYCDTGSILDWNENAFTNHFATQIARYNKVMAVNLIDKNGKSRTVRDQAQLGTAYQKYAKKYDKDKLDYVWFDFHHECRNMKWGNLSLLMKEVENEFIFQGCFQADSTGRIVSRQKGVFRVNCMDNLDRTNVVMSLFGRRCLLMALNAYDPQYPNVLDSPYTSFERIFKNVWADNADVVSILYAGTGALKTDFTRTGKRTPAGALQDGVNSVVRYYLNNFCDGRRQDSYDLFVKNYVPDKKLPSPFSFQQSNSFLYFFICSIAACTFIGIGTISMLPRGHAYATKQTALLVGLGTFLVLGHLVLKKGMFYGVCRKFVCKPAFCPGGYPQNASVK